MIWLGSHHHAGQVFVYESYPAVMRSALHHSKNDTMNCTSLKLEQVSFEKYIGLIRDVAGRNISYTSMAPCLEEICSTLYGTGNSDVSGIGVR